MPCSVVRCSVMRCSVVLCHALLCHAMLCHALFCHALLRSLSRSSKARGRTTGIPVGPGGLAAAVCRAGGPGGLFLKSNNPNLSGGEKQLCYVMPCYVMPCYVVLCSVMRCSVVLSCSVLSCHVVSCSVLACFVMLCGVLSCHVLSCSVLSCSAPFCPVRRRRGGVSPGIIGRLGVLWPRYGGRAGQEVCP